MVLAAVEKKLMKCFAVQQTDEQMPCGVTVRAMRTRHAVKNYSLMNTQTWVDLALTIISQAIKFIK